MGCIIDTEIMSSHRDKMFFRSVQRYEDKILALTNFQTEQYINKNLFCLCYKTVKLNKNGTGLSVCSYDLYHPSTVVLDVRSNQLEVWETYFA